MNEGAMVNFVKNNFKKNKNLIFYLSFFSVALIIHFLLPLDWADDAVFYNKTLQFSLAEFLSSSARPIVDTFTYVFVKYPVFWRILNPLMLVVSSFLLSEYLPPVKNEKLKNIIICFLMIYPSMIVVDAGFIATTLNYLWSVTFGLLCLLPSYKKIQGEKLNYFVMVLLVPCLLYAVNMQQLAVVLVVLLGAANIYFMMKKDFSPYVCLQFLITVAYAIYSYIINTVGDNPRMLREINRYFPEFGSLSLFEKVELGFSSTFYCMTMEHHFAWFGFFMFLIFMAFQIYRKSKNLFNRIVVLFPVLFSIFGIIQSFFTEKQSTLSKYIPGELHNCGLNKAVYSFELIPDVVFVLIVLCVLYSLFVLIENKGIYIVACFVFFLGLGSRMIMGFSPTVWASGYRTFYIMFVSLVIVSFLVVSEKQKTDKNEALYVT